MDDDWICPSEQINVSVSRESRHRIAAVCNQPSLAGALHTLRCCIHHAFCAPPSPLRPPPFPISARASTAPGKYQTHPYHQRISPDGTSPMNALVQWQHGHPLVPHTDKSPPTQWNENEELLTDATAWKRNRAQSTDTKNKGDTSSRGKLNYMLHPWSSKNKPSECIMTTAGTMRIPAVNKFIFLNVDTCRHNVPYPFRLTFPPASKPKPS